MSIDDQIKSLTKNEMTVLYWKCRGLKYEQIRSRLGYSKDWVQLQMSTAYAKLGFKKSMHWTERTGILKKDVCPRLPKTFEAWEPREEVIEKSTGEVIETTADPEMMALVVYDEYMLAQTQGPQSVVKADPEIIQIPSEIRRKSSCLSRILTTAIFLAIVAVAGFVGYFFGRDSVPKVPPETVIITPTFPPNPIESFTPLSTETSFPTITFTPEPTVTTVPTNTPKGYYDENEAVVLKDGIYMYLGENFNTLGGPCGKPEPGFGVIIVVENDISDQFLVRIDSGGFSAVDDLGNKYKLARIGLTSSGFCSDPIGVPLEYTMTYGSWRTVIAMQFEGQVPLEATYIFVTADWISGVGPITFRKSIY